MPREERRQGGMTRLNVPGQGVSKLRRGDVSQLTSQAASFLVQTPMAAVRELYHISTPKTILGTGPSTLQNFPIGRQCLLSHNWVCPPEFISPEIWGGNW